MVASITDPMHSDTSSFYEKDPVNLQVIYKLPNQFEQIGCSDVKTAAGTKLQRNDW